MCMYVKHNTKKEIDEEEEIYDFIHVDISKYI